METADLTHHISRRFNEDLENVRNQVLQMGGFVEQQLHKAITALVEGDSRLGESVAVDDYKVNGMEVSIDEECSRILALRAPAAGDLRVIVAIIKTITDLERIGDEGEKIGYIASRLATLERPADKYREVKHLGRQVAQMVHDALDAFARMDSKAALKTAREDKMVDEEYESIQRQCITFMMEDPRTIRRALEIMWIVRALERIGDHAKNICEYVIYMVLGKDIRHTSLEDVAVDREYEALMRQCITFMMEDPRTIRRVMDLIWSVRALERIGDHARNIAEYVIYFVKGKDVRHIGLEAMEREVKGE